MTAIHPAVDRGTTSIGAGPARPTSRLPAVALFIVFFTAYRWGMHLHILDSLYGTDTVDFFYRFQLDSDALVLERFEANLEHGLLSNHLALGSDGDYHGQFGLAGWLITVLPTVLIGTAGGPLIFTTVAALNAALATAAARATARALSWGAAIVMTFALVQPWPSAIAHSVYWTIGLKLVPAWALVRAMRGDRVRPGRLWLVTFASSVLVFLSGYEYATVVVAAALGVIAYYAVRNRSTLPRMLGQGALVLSATVAGLGAALAIHVGQLSAKLGSRAEAIDVVMQVVAKRTGAAGGVDVDPDFLDSLGASPGAVLERYLRMPVFGAPERLPMVHLFTVAALLLVCAVAIVLSADASQRRGGSNGVLALGVAWFVTLLGPLGWFLLARPHSYIHTHINYALWFLPTVPLGLALLWATLARRWSALRSHPVMAAAVIGTAVILLLFYGFSLMTVV